MDISPSHLLAARPLGTLTATCGYAVLNEPLDGTFQLQWGNHAIRCSEALNRLYFARPQPHNSTPQLESLQDAMDNFVELAQEELDLANRFFRAMVTQDEPLREVV